MLASLLHRLPLPVLWFLSWFVPRLEAAGSGLCDFPSGLVDLLLPGLGGAATSKKSWSMKLSTKHSWSASVAWLMYLFR